MARSDLSPVSWDELLGVYGTWFDLASRTAGGERTLVEKVGRWIRERDVFWSAPPLWHGWMDAFSQELLIESARGWSSSLRESDHRPVPPVEPLVRRAVTEVCWDLMSNMSSGSSEEERMLLLSVVDEIVERREYFARELYEEEEGTAEQLLELAFEAEHARDWEDAADYYRWSFDEIEVRRRQLQALDTDDPDDDLSLDRSLIPDERLRAQKFVSTVRLAQIEVRLGRLSEALSLYSSVAREDDPISFWVIDDAEVEAADSGPKDQARELWGPRAVLSYEKSARPAHRAATVGQASVLLSMGIVEPAVGILIEAIDKGSGARARHQTAEARDWWTLVTNAINNATFPDEESAARFSKFRQAALPEIHRFTGDLEFSAGNKWAADVAFAQAAELGDDLASKRLQQHGSSVEAVRAEAVARATGRSNN